MDSHMKATRQSALPAGVCRWCTIAQPMSRIQESHPVARSLNSSRIRSRPICGRSREITPRTEKAGVININTDRKITMNYAIVGFGAVGQALALAFARRKIEVTVASRRPPEALVPQARAIGPTIVPKALQDAIKADTIVLGGTVVATRTQRRLEAIERTLIDVSAGNLARRIPTRGNGDDIDVVFTHMNHAFARLSALVEGMRQVSTDIAHDLKTPLNRLGLTIEQALQRLERSEDATDLPDAFTPA